MDTIDQDNVYHTKLGKFIFKEMENGIFYGIPGESKRLTFKTSDDKNWVIPFYINGHEVMTFSKLLKESYKDISVGVLGIIESNRLERIESNDDRHLIANILVNHYKNQPIKPVSINIYFWGFDNEVYQYKDKIFELLSQIKK